MEKVDQYAKIIWEYMLMHQELEKADIIFVLGSNDLRVADRAAEIFKEGWAPLVVCSGANGKMSDFTEPEAKIFSERMISKGIPASSIILEQNSMNTGENILFTKKLLKEKNINIKKIIAVQKPYMERRVFTAMKKQWSEVDFIITSQKVSYEDYYTSPEFKRRNIETMVGDLFRIREYPKLGFQIEQEIPENVWQAGQELVKLGYDKYAYIIK